jgi:hypothetical protein
VNSEALMRAAGQNLKRLLKKRGWGRRPYPTEALHAPLFGLFLLASYYFFEVLLSFLGNGSEYLMSKSECNTL